MLRATRYVYPLVLLAAMLACAPRAALAQYAYSRAQLDQLLAPIALYPDPLLSQILMAATYPAEVAEAAQWSRAHPELAGDDAVRAASSAPWDPSVQSLVAFPQLLERMGQNPAWVQALGDAFLMQQADVMAAVQALRRRAQAEGSLYSDDHMIMVDENGVIRLEPTAPQIVYVPYYDPLVVYGAWMWPSYPPVAWSPWPGYAVLRRPGVHITFYWGTGIRVAAGFFFGAPDWHRHRVDVVNVHAFYYYRPRHNEPYLRTSPGPWRHNPHHRQGVEYRHPELQRRYAPQSAPRLTPQQREEQRRREMQRNAPQYAPRLTPQQREEQRRREMRRNAPQYAPRTTTQQREQRSRGTDDDRRTDRDTRP